MRVCAGGKGGGGGGGCRGCSRLTNEPEYGAAVDEKACPPEPYCDEWSGGEGLFLLRHMPSSPRARKENPSYAMSCQPGSRRCRFLPPPVGGPPPFEGARRTRTDALSMPTCTVLHFGCVADFASSLR